MDPFESKIQDIARQTSLTESERELMRERVLAYMDMRPVRTKQQAKESPAFAGVWSLFRSQAAPAFLAVALILSGSGVSYAAESAMPGDLLYAVKLHVNEEFIDAFQFSPSARLAWAAERAERRLDEAALLASRGELTSDLQVALESNFQAQASELAQRTKELEDLDPASAATVSTDIEASLEAHEMILARLAAEDEENDSTRRLAESVRGAAKRVAAVRMQAEEEFLAQAALQGTEEGMASTSAASKGTTSTEARRIRVEKMRESALIRIEGARDALNSLDTSERADLRDHAEIQITSAEELYREGERALEEKDLSAAYVSFRDAASHAARIRQILEAENLFSIPILPSDVYATSTDTDEVEVGEDATIREQMAANAHARAKTEISEAQYALLTPAEDTERAGRLLKDAQVFLIRGEIALVNDDIEDAIEFFRSAQSRARAAAALVKVDEPEQEQEESEEDEQEGEEGVLIQHSFEDGVHTYQGTIIVPTPCHALTTTADVSKSLPERVRLELHVAPPAPGLACIQVLAEKEFSIQVEAAERARLSSVEINDEEINFEVQEVAATSSTTGTDAAASEAADGSTSTEMSPTVSSALEMGRTLLDSLR